MKIPRRRRAGVKFDITPLIDVVFQLIIFFLAATYIVRSDANEPVQLPKASEVSDRLPVAPNRWTVTITSERVWWLGNQRTDRAAVEQKLQHDTASGHNPAEIEIRVRADARVPFSEVEPLMIACAKLGIRKLGFAVLRDTDSKN